MEPAELLTLAAISYRGCELNLSIPHSRRIIFDEINRCLHAFPAVRDKWEVVWGPAGYNLRKLGLDDSAMYVVRRTDQPTDLAVVIRGTNFFSLDDWLSNLRIDPVAWQRSGAETDASITRSTADGLRILQQLRAEPVPPRDAVLTPEEMADAAVVAGEAAVAYQLLQKILTHRQAEDLTAFAARLETLVQDHMKADAALVVRQAEAVKAAASLQPSTTTSTNLMQFLQNYVKTAAAPVNLWVVGHSKGGALAPALALWLGESRSKGTGNWDPENRVALHLATFAAPTPGDGRFAQYVYKMMGKCCNFESGDEGPAASS